MTDKTDRVTRGDIERGLLELTGFKRDAAEIAAFMDAIDIYAAFLADRVTEPFLHLLSQQAELLLDSRQSISARLDQLERTAKPQEVASLPAVELTEQEREIVRAVLPVSEQVERELARLEEAEKRREAADEHTRISEEIQLIEDAAGEAAGIRDAGTHFEVLCHNCRQWKGTAMFYRNQKSKTGYETKCRDCRPQRAKAA